MLTINKYRIISQYSEQDASTAKYFGYFEDNADVVERDVSGNTATSYRGDFIGLLRYYKVHPALHSFNLFLNRFSTATKYNGERKIKLCNDSKIIKQLEKNFSLLTVK